MTRRSPSIRPARSTKYPARFRFSNFLLVLLFLLAGFPLLTIGILIGTLWARQVEEGGTKDIVRAAVGYAMWLLIAGVLLLRAVAGWRGRRAAYGTIAGFGMAVIVLILYLLRGSTHVTPVANVGMPHEESGRTEKVERL